MTSPGLPVALLRRIAAAPPAAPAGERCEMCGEPIADEHQHVVDLESRAMMCTCRPCYLLFTDSNAHLRYRSVPDRYLSFADFELARPNGTSWRSRSDWPSSSATPGWTGRWPSIRVPPAPPNPSCRWTPGTPCWRRTRSCPCGPDTEALLIRVPGPDRAAGDCHLVPIDACYELVGHLRRLWRGFDGGQEARDQLAALLRHGQPPEQAGARCGPGVDPRRQRPEACRDRPDLRRLDIQPEPYAAAPQLTAILRVRSPAGPPSTPSPCGARSGSCRSAAATRRRGDRAAGPVRRAASRWPTTLKPFLWMQCSTMVQGFTGTPRSTSPLPCTFDFEVSAAKYLQSLRDGMVPLELLFSGTVFTRGEPASAWSRCPGTSRPRTGLPVDVWRRLMDQYFPNTGWLRLDRDMLTALPQYKAARGLTTWDATVESLLANAAAGSPQHCRRGPVRRGPAMSMSLSLARAVADAVLYEGYLLYPYRASSSKNQARWQFGILGPPGAAAAGIGRGSRHVRRLPPRRPGRAAAVDLHVRFLQLQSRTAEQADDDGGFRPVDELARGAARWLSWDEAVESGSPARAVRPGRAQRGSRRFCRWRFPAARTSRNSATHRGGWPEGWSAVVVRSMPK